MELNTSQPQHAQIISKPSRNPILYIVVGIVLIAITALGLLVWQKNQELGEIMNRLADTEKQLTDSVKSTPEKASDLPLIQKLPETLSEDEQKAAALVDSSDYYCAVVDFGCDKVTTQVNQFQKITDSKAGYAKIVATNATGKKLTLWLKHRAGGAKWIVFYEGEAMPSAAITKQFDVPTDFLAVN